VAASDDIAASDVVRCLTNLVTKSLVVSDVGGMTARYGLLNTTRAYALEKLAESGEAETIARRHAGFHRDLFERAEAEWGSGREPTCSKLTVAASTKSARRSTGRFRRVAMHVSASR
jgi:predicted ATPase